MEELYEEDFVLDPSTPSSAKPSHAKILHVVTEAELELGDDLYPNLVEEKAVWISGLEFWHREDEVRAATPPPAPFGLP